MDPSYTPNQPQNPIAPQPGAMPGYAPTPNVPAGQYQAQAMPQVPPAQPMTPGSFPPPQPSIPQDPQQPQMAPPAQPDGFPHAVQPSASAMPGMPNQTIGAQPGVKPAQNTPNSTQNALLIAEIRDGIVIMSDGSFRSVVMVKSINFDLMSPQEQEAVEYSYQGFLNSLYFPIQVFIRSQKVDLQPYIEKLDKIRTEHDNMLLAMMMDDYIDYIDSLAQQTNIMDKKFYIVIPFFPVVDVQKALSQSKNFITGLTALFDRKDQHVVINEEALEKAKTELRNRVQLVLSGLMQCNIQGLPLDTQELIELFYDSYNPDTATRQQLKNFSELTADVVTKGEGMAPQAHLQRELG